MRNKIFFTIVCLGTVWMAVLLQITGKPLKTVGTSLGILNLEFAQNANATRQIVDVWERNNLIPVAEIHTARDFVFILFYSLFLFSFCKWLSKKTGPGMSFKKISNGLSYAALFAGLMDVAENAGMLVSLTGRVSEKITALTFYTSVTKWAIVAFCLLWIIAGIFYVLFKKNRKAKIDSAFAY